jgi:hypothetical protein
MDNYERELTDAAAVLQGVLPIGVVKAIGLREVAAGCRELAAEVKMSRAALRRVIEVLSGANRECQGGLCIWHRLAPMDVAELQIKIWDALGELGGGR